MRKCRLGHFIKAFFVCFFPVSESHFPALREAARATGLCSVSFCLFLQLLDALVELFSLPPSLPPSRLSPCLTSAVRLIPQLRSLYSSSFICHFSILSSISPPCTQRVLCFNYLQFSSLLAPNSASLLSHCVSRSLF